MKFRWFSCEVPYFFLIYSCAVLIFCRGQSITDSLNLRDGEAQYSILVKQAQVPLYGGCWQTAIERLHVDCANLTDELQSRLALLFTNCFLDKSGIPTRPCPTRTAIGSCTKILDQRSFTAYTTFFTHTQNMCFFLKSNLWRKQTENTISRLVDASNVVGSNMERNLELQERLMVSQEQSLESVKSLVGHGQELNRAVEASKFSISELMREFHERSGEQRQMFGEIYRQIDKVRMLVFGEIASIYSLAYYVCSLMIVYLLTCTRRSEGSRFWIFIIFSVSFYVENSFSYFNVKDNFVELSTSARQDIMYHRTWMLRKLVIIVCIFVFLVFCFIYQDISQANHHLLKELMAVNQEMKAFMSNCDVSRISSSSIPRNEKVDIKLADEAHDESGYEAEVDEQSKQNGPETLKPKNNFGNLDTVTVQKRRKPGRPKIIKSTNLDSNIDRYQLDYRYNLRERASRSPLQFVEAKFNEESPETFSMIVKRMAKVSKENGEKLRKVILKNTEVYNKSNRAQYSSGDE